MSFYANSAVKWGDIQKRKAVGKSWVVALLEVGRTACGILDLGCIFSFGWNLLYDTMRLSLH